MSMWERDSYAHNHNILFTMSASTSREVLQLYRKLLRYGKELKFTDQNYFRRRVRKEFKLNIELQSEADIRFNIKVNVLLASVKIPNTAYYFIYTFPIIRRATHCCNGNR